MLDQSLNFLFFPVDGSESTLVRTVGEKKNKDKNQPSEGSRTGLDASGYACRQHSRERLRSRCMLRIPQTGSTAYQSHREAM